MEALTSQAGQLWHTSNLYQIPQQEKLAYRLAQHAQLDQTFFCNSGAEANEAAVKVARRFQYRSGHPERIKVICAGGAFHGRTLAMLAATDKELFREGFGPMPAGFVHVPFGNLNALRDIMSDDVISTSEKIEQIKLELNTYYKTIRFTRCRSMGEIVKLNLKLSLTRQD